MGRLTERELSENGKVMCYDPVYTGKDLCNDSCMHGTCKWSEQALKKLWDLENKKEQGKLIELPCKVGDTVYII